jgi:NarL family two-component system sensor histidine kinase LiaS
MMQIIDHIRRPFNKLRWKLTASYIAVTVGALLVLEVVLISMAVHNISQESRIDPSSLLETLETTYVPLASPYLSKIPADYQAVRSSLKSMNVSDLSREPIRLGDLSLRLYSTNVFFVILVSSDGTLVDVLPYNFLRDSQIGEPFQASEIPEIQEPLQAALMGVSDHELLHRSENEDYTVGAVPVFDEIGKDQVVGALAFVRKTGFWDIITLAGFARQVGGSLLVISIFAGLLGSIFGSITARGLVRRLNGLFASARAWSKGDFSISVHDPVQDELGRLATGLNQMASRLGNLLKERQHMSVIEERNRLARDLHDSVKQSAFAASAQLGTALVDYPTQGDVTHSHLLEADKLLDSVRKDLTDLIHELRPINLQSKGLAAGLQEYCSDWAKQSDLDVSVCVHGDRILPAEVEHSLFRIIQGSLSNIARHSKASRAEIELNFNPTSVTLIVTDNGKGFDIDKKHKGLGLRSIQERVDLLGGTLDIQSKVGEGTTITVKCIR